MLRIQVKVLAKEAQLALRQIQKTIQQVNQASASMGKGGGGVSGMNSGLNATSAHLKKIQQGLASLGGSGAFSSLSKQAQAYNKTLASINQNLRTMGQQKSWQTGGAPTSNVNSSAAQRARTAYNNPGAAVTGSISSASSAATALQPQLTALGRLSLKVNGEMKKSRMGMIQMGKDMQWVGRQINFNFTIPLILAGKTAMTWALDVSAAFTRVQKVYGQTGQDYTAELNKIKKAIRALSDIYGVAQEDVMSLAASWAAAGATGADLAKSVETSLKLNILGDYTDLQATFSDLITIQGAYKYSSEQLATAITLLNTVDNMTAVQLQDLVTGIARAGGAANVAGIDIQHLAAMMAVLTPATGSAANAGNMLKTTISRLMSPTGEAIDVLKELGINFEDASYQALSGTGRLELLAATFGDLSDAQKAVVATTLGSRFQFNKLVVLLDDMNSKTSTYKKVLDSLRPENISANFAEANREINTLLNSDPKKLEILTTMIKNLMIDAIQPMIPVLTGVLTTIRGVFEWFGNLSPTIQKFAMGFLILISVIGIAAQMFGSVQLLFGTFLRFLIFVAGLIPGVGLTATAAATTTATSTAAITGAITAQTQAITATLAAAASQQTAGVAAAATAQTAIVSGAAASQAGAVVAAEAVVAASPVLMIAAIAAAIVAALVLFAVFHKQIIKWVGGAIDKIKQGFNSLPKSVQNALLAVARVVENIIKTIIHWLSYLNPFQRHSPSLVDNVTAGVSVIIDQYRRLYGIGSIFARSASDLRDFAAATADVVAASKAAERADQKKKVIEAAPQASVPLDALYSDLDRLQAALDPVSAAIAIQEQVVAPLAAAYNIASAQVKLFEAEMAPLKNSVESLSTQIEDAKKIIQDFADTSITGMGAMDDALFANEMAQKALKLEMLQLGPAGESYDQIRDKISKLNGEIESVRGEMTNMRNAGAGSDVLSVFQDQLTALEAQKSVLVGAANNGAALEDQLAALQKQADIMDLQKSLQFDPLLRQIDQLANATHEMSFEAIIAGITEQRNRVDDLTVTYDQQKAALDAQQTVLDSMIASRDHLGEIYDIENAKLDLLKAEYTAIEDQMKAIEDAINAVIAANEKLKASGSGGSSAFDAAAAGDYTNDPLPTFGSDLNLDQLLKQWQDQAAGLFKFNPFGFLKHWVDVTSKWWYGTVVPWFSNLVSSITGIFSGWSFPVDLGSWGKEIGKWLDMFDPILEAVTHIFNAVNDVVTVSLKVLGIILWPAMEAIKGIWVAAWAVLAAVIKPIWDVISGIVLGALKAIRGVIMFFVNLINGDWGKAWESIKDVFAGIWDIIYQLTVGITKVIIGLFVGLIKGIIGAFDTIWDDMWEIGKNIVNGLVDGLKKAIGAVWSFITGIPGTFMGILKNLFGINSPSTAMAEIGVNIVLGLLGGLEKTIEKVWNWIKEIPGKFLDLFSGAGEWLLDVGKKIIQGLWDGLKSAWEGVKDWFGGITDLIPDLKGPPEKDADLLKENGQLIMGGLLAGMQDTWDADVQPWLSGLGPDIANALSNIADTIPAELQGWGAMLPDGMNSFATQAFSGDDWKVAISTVLSGVDGIKRSIFSDGVGGSKEGWIYQVGDQFFFISDQLDQSIRKSADLQGVLGLLDARKSALNLANDFDSARKKIAETEVGSRDYQLTLISIQEEVARYATEVAKLPQEQITQVVALLDQGKLDEAEALLKAFEDKKREVTFNAKVNGITAFVGPGGETRYRTSDGMVMFAQGGIIKKPTIGMIGEAGPEVIIPLTNARRAMELMQKSGLIRLAGSGIMNRGAIATNGSGPIVQSNGSKTTNLTFTGDLSFPNITSGDDADKFLANLEVLAG